MSADFKSYSNELIGRVRAGNEVALITLGVNIVTEAKNLAPVDYGQLRNSIQWKTTKSAGGYISGHFQTGKNGKTFQGGADGERLDKRVNPKANELYVGATAQHSIYQEFGTKYQRPQSFMRPAINKFVKGKKTAESIGKIINAYLKKFPEKAVPK